MLEQELNFSRLILVVTDMMIMISCPFIVQGHGMLGFFHRCKSETYAAAVRIAAKRSKYDVVNILRDNEVARREFWNYIFDTEDFRQWKPECKLALFEEAYFDGLLTLCDNNKAMALVLATSMVLMLIPAIPMSLSLGPTVLILPGLMLGLSIITASFFLNMSGITLNKENPDLGGKSELEEYSQESISFSSDR